MTDFFQSTCIRKTIDPSCVTWHLQGPAEMQMDRGQVTAYVCERTCVCFDISGAREPAFVSFFLTFYVVALG